MRTTRVIAVALIVVFGLAGCGKKSSNANSPSKTPTLEAYDFNFSSKTLNVKAGDAVKLTFKNEGKAEHNFSITSLNVSTDLESGKTTTVTFTASAPGDQQFFCKYHKDSYKMVGTLHVI